MPETNPTEINFIEQYLEYTAKTECPKFFHRWTAINSLAAYLGRSIHFKHGHFTIYPNLYTMLIGSPGTKKSSAIKIGAKLIKQAGYKTFAAKKTRQEKFLLDLAEQSERRFMAQGGSLTAEGSDILEQNLFGTEEQEDPADAYLDRPPAEMYVAADEFNNFIGINNLDFVSILGELWDYEGVYDYKLKSADSVFIPHPTVNILGGNTPTGFAHAFPPETIGQGFFSRLLLVYGEPTGVKYTFPPEPSEELQGVLIHTLHRIKAEVSGEVELTPEAEEAIDKIYHTWEGLDDMRFEHYANRRLAHLIKLCMVVMASRISTRMEKRDVIEANTLLTFTELLMPKALGEFGRSKNSAVAHRVMAVIDAANAPITLQGIWKAVHQDLDNRNQLIEMLNNLQVADKIQPVGGGYLPLKPVRDLEATGLVNFTLLTKEERELV